MAEKWRLLDLFWGCCLFSKLRKILFIARDTRCPKIHLIRTSSRPNLALCFQFLFHWLFNDKYSILLLLSFVQRPPIALLIRFTFETTKESDVTEILLVT